MRLPRARAVVEAWRQDFDQVPPTAALGAFHGPDCQID